MRYRIHVSLSILVLSLATSKELYCFDAQQTLGDMYSNTLVALCNECTYKDKKTLATHLSNLETVLHTLNMCPRKAGTFASDPLEWYSLGLKFGKKAKKREETDPQLAELFARSSKRYFSISAQAGFIPAKIMHLQNNQPQIISPTPQRLITIPLLTHYDIS